MLSGRETLTPRSLSVPHDASATTSLLTQGPIQSGSRASLPVTTLSSCRGRPRSCLRRSLASWANGQGVTVTPSNAMLTTQQAADFLNVSRPYLIKLLEAGEIRFEKVGTHRRVAFAELMQYKRREDQERRRAADELTELGQELGEL